VAAGGPRALVLGYHDITSEAAPFSGFQNPEAGRYKASEVDFRRHLSLLAGAPGVAPSTVSCARDLPAGGVFHGLTFDDGGANAVLTADVLEEHGWRGHFFVVTSQIGRDGFLTARSIMELVSRGHVVGSHSHTHPAMMARMEPGSVRAEWARSRSELEDVLGAAVRTASVPGGSTSRMVEGAAAECGIEVLFTSEPRTAMVHREGCLVVGRYQLYGSESAETALAIARGDRLPRLRRAVAWGSRRVAHRVLGRNYLRIRHALLH
jgi:peptidoglycan/xylan/chitin deacetylase (PgdA/CDA1 family)